MKKLILALVLAFVAPLANADQLLISSGGFLQTFNGAFTTLDMTKANLVMRWTTSGTTPGSLTSTGRKRIWTFELIGQGEDSHQSLSCVGSLTVVGFSRNVTLVC